MPDTSQLSPCPICAGTTGWRIAHNHDVDIEVWRREIGETAPYVWTLCATCANAYPSTPPDPRVLARYWERNRDVPPDDPAAAEAIWRHRQSIAQVGAERSWLVLKPFLGTKKGRFLDIACGLGETVARFGRDGWQAEGIDVDAATRPFHERLGLKTRIGRFEDDTETDRYDLIQVAHAIYFMTDPMRFLGRVRERLEPDGTFAIVISNLLAATDNSRPAYAHTFYPCAQSMRYALGRAGFETLLVKRWGGSIYLVARPGDVSAPPVDVQRIRLLYASKDVRYRLLGTPALAVRRVAKRMIGRRS